jgi:hypothetical protein
MLARLTAVAVAIIAAIGWALVAYQLATDRWVDATGLVVLSAIGATVGAACVIAAMARQHLTVAVAGLLLVGVAASVFAYPLSVMALVLLIAIIVQSLSARLRTARPASG